MMSGIIIIPSTMPPARAENPFIGITTSAYTTMPQMMEGTPLSTSAQNRIHQLSQDPPYSDRKMPPRTPTGIPMSDASPSNWNVPAMALAMPPPASPTGLGSFVKKSPFTAPLQDLRAE